MQGERTMHDTSLSASGRISSDSPLVSDAHAGDDEPFAFRLSESLHIV